MYVSITVSKIYFCEKEYFQIVYLKTIMCCVYLNVICNSKIKGYFIKNYE